MDVFIYGAEDRSNGELVVIPPANPDDGMLCGSRRYTYNTQLDPSTGGFWHQDTITGRQVTALLSIRGRKLRARFVPTGDTFF